MSRLRLTCLDALAITVRRSAGSTGLVKCSIEPCLLRTAEVLFTPKPCQRNQHRALRTNRRYRLYDRQALSEVLALVRHRAAGVRPQQAALLVKYGRVAAAIPKAQQRFRSR